MLIAKTKPIIANDLNYIAIQATLSLWMPNRKRKKNMDYEQVYEKQRQQQPNQ